MSGFLRLRGVFETLPFFLRILTSGSVNPSLVERIEILIRCSEYSFQTHLRLALSSVSPLAGDFSLQLQFPFLLIR